MGIKLLLADDNAMMRGFLVRLLEKFDEIDKVVAVENGQKAVDEAQSYDPDVILLDVEMPVMDGLEATKAIKKLQKEKKLKSSTRIIILSGTMHENDANVKRAKFLGADEVLAKPEGKSVSMSIEASKLKRAIIG